MRIALNVQLTGEETTFLDKILHAAGFQNRTDYVTALLQTTIYGGAETPQSIPPVVGTWISAVREIAETYDKTLDAILAVYDETAFPVIAMRGGRTALEHLRYEIESAVLDRCGVLPAPEDLELCMKVYQSVRRPKLLQYRTHQLADQFMQDKKEREEKQPLTHPADSEPVPIIRREDSV